MSTDRTITRRSWLARAAAAGAAVGGAHIWEAASMADGAGMVRVVDSNVHVWKSDPRYPWAADLKDPPEPDALPSALLELMRMHNVDRTVIVHVIYYRWDCRYTAACVRERGDKFMGVCRIDPQSPTAAADVDHWVAEGLRGVRLSPGPGPAGDWIGDRRQMDLICGRSAQLGVPLCVLCSTSRLPDLEQVIERHRDRLDVCIDHMAECPIDRPEELQKLLALARYKRVFVKLSHLWSLSRQEYPYRDTHDQVRRLYDAFGPERLMWGTDWPVVEKYCGYGHALALFRGEIKFFTDEDRRWILGGTALRLWPSDRTG